MNKERPLGKTFGGHHPIDTYPFSIVPAKYRSPFPVMITEQIADAGFFKTSQKNINYDNQN